MVYKLVRIRGNNHDGLSPGQKARDGMKNVKAFVLAGLVGSALIVGSGIAVAEDISGTIVRTLMLSETSRLVGDVTCQVTGAPCIAFGAPNIALNLNGFTITGPNDPATGCGGTSVGTDTGISSNGQSNVGIRGPGLVQRFRGDGILFVVSAPGWVQGVTVSTNCLSGIRIGATSAGISVEGNVSVRNGTPAAACGGI